MRSSISTSSTTTTAIARLTALASAISTTTTNIAKSVAMGDASPPPPPVGGVQRERHEQQEGWKAPAPVAKAGEEGEHLLCLLPFPEPVDILSRIRAKHPNIKIVYRTVHFKRGRLSNADPVPEELFHQATILCTLSLLPAPGVAPNLKFIHLISAGTDHISTTPIYKDTNTPLTTASGIHGPMISEWVILQLLSASHKQKTLLKWQAEHTWGGMLELGEMRDAVGMRLGVLGYGSIGRQAARVCKAMGMDVIAFTASPRTTPESKRDHGYIVPGTGDIDGTIPSAWYSGLDATSRRHFLAQDIDILLVSVPLTKETRHFLAAPEFEILGARKNAFILNISRGSIFNQKDLATYLKKTPEEGGLRGAALDVTDPEPLEKDDELWDLENVIITPHISGLSVAYIDRALQILDWNLTRAEEGKPLVNLVDRKRGY